MIYYKDFCINPEKYRVPQYNISPFSTEWVKENHRIVKDHFDRNDTLLNSFFGDNHLYFNNGKEALHQALFHYSLSKDDEIYIITTTGNRYISSCVTTEIEKFCRWSRQLSDKTKVILVVHEFGMIYDKMEEIKAFGFPIIEDMAMSLFSTDFSGRAGTYGDFTVFSLPKFLPIQFGGVLRINNESVLNPELSNDHSVVNSLQKLCTYYLREFEEIKKKRKKNYDLFNDLMKPLGIFERFKVSINETPSVFMFAIPKDLDKDKLKLFLQSNGVEASVFYGDESFFVPVHQNLDVTDVEFIVSLIEYFYNANK